MGFFSKKTFTCERCGKEYEARFELLGNGLCKECGEEKKKAEKAVSGYVDYGWKIGRNYDLEQLREIAAHRDRIFEKYKDRAGITKAELENAGENYKKLSESEAEDIYARALNSCFKITMGAASSAAFFCPTQYDGTIVDSEDVFAVGYCTDITDFKSNTIRTEETILCVVFTNDPYIPVFPMVYSGNLGLFEGHKSKKGRQALEYMFTVMCPNLCYPVSDIKDLKKMVKKEGSKGKPDSAFLLEQITNASIGSKIFKTKEMFGILPPVTKKMLAEYGYLPYDEVSRLLKLDSVFAGKFWNQIAQKLDQ